jgi:hydroxymethylpyrimidine/phosphomethylpyrimidine kinase
LLILAKPLLQNHNKHVMNSNLTQHAVTIAGSDSCGGAGIQVDLKTMSHFGVYGASVITAVTAQNTTGVSDVAIMEAGIVERQLAAVLEDLPITAAKTGMLANADIIRAVSQGLNKWPDIALVVDPVMVATTGARLLDLRAEEVMIGELLPRARLVTPNLPEARALTGMDEGSEALALADRLLQLGCQAVLVKGGHAGGEQVEDWLVTGNDRLRFANRRINASVHGTGCALSAAITAGLARDLDLGESVATAIEWLHKMLQRTWQPKAGRLRMLPF